jgi:two-component system, LytTR family, response regulator LytT
MWIRIRAVIIEDEPLAAQYLAELLDETCQVEVVGSATESEAGLRLCAELRPDAVFVDISLLGKDGVSLATQLAMLPQPPRLVFTTGNANRATDAFRLEAVDYLLKPLDPEQVNEAVNRLLAYLRPFEDGSSPSSGGHANGVPRPDKMRFPGTPNELLPVKDMDRDRIRLLARREVAAALRRDRRTWVHTVAEGREQNALRGSCGSIVDGFSEAEGPLRLAMIIGSFAKLESRCLGGFYA